MALTKINANVIANNTIAVGNIADNSVDATKIASNSILTRHIDDAQITTDQIAANTIATANIADNAVDGTKIASNSILTRHIDDDQVTGDQLSDNITIAGTLTSTGAFTSPGIDDNADATAITISSSENVTLAGNLALADAKIINIGDSSDLQLYHSGGSSYIKNDTGTLIVRADSFRVLNNANSEQIFHADADGAVTLYHNNAVKLATTSTGVTVTGALIDGVSNYAGLEVKGSGGSRPMIQWSNANNGDLCAIYGTEGNAMTFASGSSNTAHMTLDSSGRLFVGATGTALGFQSQYHVLGVGNGTFIAEDTGISALFFNLLDTGTKYYAEGSGKMAGRIFFNKTDGSYNFQNTTVGGNAGATAGTLRNNMTLTSDGSLTVSQHSGVSDITPALRIQGGASNANTAIFYTIQGAGFSGADPAMILGKHTGNNRSLNAGGTLNASGNDYAEYMYKADGCGTITKGEVCGVDVNGKLTKTFSNAISFVIKSTDPSYVGGDAWGSVDKGFTKEELEAERQKVDRIAFSGQVPVNITGSFSVGDYVYPQVNSSGIKAVAKSSPTFEEYQLCVGKIWATMDDGRPLVAVKIG